MAYPTARSCNAELSQGAIDGTYKQVAPNRGGVIDPRTLRARRDLDDIWFGIHEAPVKELPDCLSTATPTYAPTPPAHCC